MAYLLPILSYLSGAVPYSLLIGKAKGVDLRKVGSKNIGATNVARNLGMRWGVIALLLDALKGFLPVLAVRMLLADHESAKIFIGVTLVAAPVGHMFTVFLLFRGGKGVATTLGATFAVAPWAGLVGAVLYVGLYALFRISSLGSLAMTIAAPVTMIFTGVAWEVIIAAAVTSVLIWIKHIPNIRRLIRGEEKRV
jgi:glycerol-3-phosphate acyltransferase PlsY